MARETARQGLCEAKLDGLDEALAELQVTTSMSVEEQTALRALNDELRGRAENLEAKVEALAAASADLRQRSAYKTGSSRAYELLWQARTICRAVPKR